MRGLEQQLELAKRETEGLRQENEALTRDVSELRQAVLSERHSLMEIEMQSSLKAKQWDMERKSLEQECLKLRGMLDSLRNFAEPKPLELRPESRQEHLPEEAYYKTTTPSRDHQPKKHTEPSP